LEYDSPINLLSNENSSFSSLVEQTGTAEAEHLRRLATRQVKAQTEKNSTSVDDEIFVSENDPLLKNE